jgi:hypothetical protein
VFTVRMVAKAVTPGPIISRGDPADLAPLHDVIIRPEDPNDPEPRPIPLDDDQVFLRQSGELSIIGAGEGEFVNRFNRFDVNADANVSAVDSLIIINTLNAAGGGSLQAISSSFANLAKVDTNMDSYLSAIDALGVINYVNRFRTSFLSSSSFVAAGEGEGEGESAPLAAAGPSGSIDDGLLALVAVDGAEGESASAASSDDALLLAAPSATSAGGSLTNISASSGGATDGDSPGQIDSAAADDVFADLSCDLDALGSLL